jgi:hypothetical protein
MTTVVNVRSDDSFTVYIGRAVPRRRLKASKWANPFKIGRDGAREQVIAKYRDYLLSRPDLLASLSELRGQRLGCWCAPAPCHGDVLAGLADDSEDQP